MFVYRYIHIVWMSGDITYIRMYILSMPVQGFI